MPEPAVPQRAKKRPRHYETEQLKDLFTRIGRSLRWFTDHGYGRGSLDLTAYKLRHTLGTFLGEANLTVPEISAMLGHSSYDTTMGYTHARRSRSADG